MKKPLTKAEQTKLKKLIQKNVEIESKKTLEYNPMKKPLTKEEIRRMKMMQPQENSVEHNAMFDDTSVEITTGDKDTSHMTFDFTKEHRHKEEEIRAEFINKYQDYATVNMEVVADHWLKIRREAIAEERERVKKIIDVPENECVNIMEYAIRVKILSDLTQE